MPKTVKEKKRFRLPFRKRDKKQAVASTKIRFDVSHSTLHEHAKHLVVLVENELNYGKKKTIFTQPAAPTWDALIAMNSIFDMHKTHIEETFNLKRGIHINQLDAIAKCVHHALKPVK